MFEVRFCMVKTSNSFLCIMAREKDKETSSCGRKINVKKEMKMKEEKVNKREVGKIGSISKT